MRSRLRGSPLVLALAALALPHDAAAQLRGGGRAPAAPAAPARGVLRGSSGPAGAPGAWGRGPGVRAPRAGGDAWRVGRRGAPQPWGWGAGAGWGRPDAYGLDPYGLDPWTGARWSRRPLRRAAPAVVVVGPWPAYGGYYAAPLTDERDAEGGEGGEDAPRTKVIEAPGASADAAAVTAEPLDGGALLRVRWSGGGAAVREVSLVVADAARRTLAAQTVHAAPYAAVFDRAGRVAFVGVTVVRADGVATTTLVPLGMATSRR